MFPKLEDPLMKDVTESPEPLILRPPVGSELNYGPFVRFRSFFRGGDRPNRRRFLCSLILLLLFVLLTILCVLFVLSLMGFPSSSFPFGSLWYSSPHASQFSPSACQLNVPSLKLRMTELLAGDGKDMFNVTLFTNKWSPAAAQMVQIMHLCRDELTVARTSYGCYIRSLDPEWRSVCSGSYATKVQNGHHLRKSAHASLSSKLWFAEPLQPLLTVFHNPYILSWCTDMSLFRLVPNPPVQDYVIDSSDKVDQPKPSLNPDLVGSQESQTSLLNSPRTPELTLEEDSFDNDESSGDHSDGSSFSDLDDLLTAMQDPQRLIKRSVRHVPEESDRTTNASAHHSDPLHCHQLDEFFEAAPIPLDSENGEVTVTRDRLVICSPKQ